LGRGFKDRSGKFHPITDSDKKSLEIIGENYADLTILLKDERENPTIDKPTKSQRLLLVQKVVNVDQVFQVL